MSTAEKNSSSRNCPLIWRIHLKLTALRGKKPNGEKDDKAARGIFYEAIRHCPSVKVLYMDALTYFPDMLKEIHDLMSEKQILIRLPLEELNVLLENENENNDETHEKAKKKFSDSDVDDDDDEIEDEENEEDLDDSKEIVDISGDNSGIDNVENDEQQQQIGEGEEVDEVSEGEITDDG